MRTKLDLKLIKESARQLSQKSEKDKNMFLRNLAETLRCNRKVILESNKKDIDYANTNHLSSAFIERLILDDKGIRKLLFKLKGLQNLDSGLGVILEKRILETGILLQKVTVPIGVIMVIYESRPEVSIDVAALCVKSGNAVILKGGSEAIKTNTALYQCIHEALLKSNLSRGTVSLINDKASTNKLLKQNDYIDLVIARGGYEMVQHIIDHSKIPVLSHSAGGARIYIDQSADLENALNILINAKVSKPAACNSLDTILVNQNIPDAFILHLVRLLEKFQVTVLGDEFISKSTGIKQAVEKDWDTEFLNLTVSIKTVKDVDEAIRFINKHGKRHTEGIIAENPGIINKFTRRVDSAGIFINCSTRFHDGYEFGMGAEMGIATGKLHARGPVGLNALTAYKWVITGHGHIRK